MLYKPEDMSSPVSPGLTHNPELRVYFSAVTGRQYAELLIGEYVLESFAYIAQELEPYRPWFAGMMLDSGAYSMQTQKREVNLQKYIDFAAPRQDAYDVIVSLDVNKDPEQTMRNTDTMWDAGIRNVMETFHYEEPIEALLEILKRAPKFGNWIGLGGIVKFSNRTSRNRFLRPLSEVLQDFPEVRVHGFGLTSVTDALPLFSCDSTSWLREYSAFRGSFNINILKTVFQCFTDREIMEMLKKKYRRLPRIQAFSLEEEGHLDLEGLIDLKKEGPGWSHSGTEKQMARATFQKAMKERDDHTLEGDDDAGATRPTGPGTVPDGEGTGSRAERASRLLEAARTAEDGSSAGDSGQAEGQGGGDRGGGRSFLLDLPDD
jgi:hypothetical protein